MASNQERALPIFGMQRYQAHKHHFELAGVIGNRLGSNRHHDLVQQSVGEIAPYWGSVKRDEVLTLAQRHLGLVQAMELDQLDSQLNQAAAFLDQCGIHPTLTPIQFEHNENLHNPTPALLNRSKNRSRKAGW